MPFLLDESLKEVWEANEYHRTKAPVVFVTDDDAYYELIGGIDE